MLDIIVIDFKFFIVKEFCFIKDKVRSSKPIVIKLIVIVKVVTNLNRA